MGLTVKLKSIDCAGKTLSLRLPQIMGVLNLTPDSFSDGGRFIGNDGCLDVDSALAAAELMVAQGASIIDVGGESTRPGAVVVSEDEQLDRVASVVEQLSSKVDAVISVDTSSPRLMTEAARLGAGMINDIRALTAPGALEAIATTNLAVCMMHMQGQPDTMQHRPEYLNIVQEVLEFFRQRLADLSVVGLGKERVLIDPGFGFGKTLDHNLELLAGLEQFGKLSCPVLVGVSRKAMIGQITDRPVKERIHGSVSAAMIAIQSGASIVRVHDVAATRDMIKVHVAVNGELD